MAPSPLGSFTRFLFGFTVLISVSLGVTYAVQKYAVAQDAQKQQAAAVAEMLKQIK